MFASPAAAYLPFDNLGTHAPSPLHPDMLFFPHPRLNPLPHVFPRHPPPGGGGRAQVHGRGARETYD